jgi:hypothetical protein
VTAKLINVNRFETVLPTLLLGLEGLDRRLMLALLIRMAGM